MLRLAADENFDGRIVRGLLRRCPTVDILRIQDTVPAGAVDTDVLDWTAQEDRILLTHDAKTIPKHAGDQLARGEHMAGVIVAADDLPIRVVIEDLVLVVECSSQEEWASQVVYLPL